MRTKIEKQLTREALRDFCSRVRGLKGEKLRDIRALASEFGVEISLPAAASFKNGPYADYLAELNSKRELADNITAIAQGGLSLSDAAAAALNQKLLDQSVALQSDDPLLLKKSNALSAALARLRTGDQRAKKLEADLRLRDEQIQKLTAERNERETKLASIKKTADSGKLTATEKERRIKEVFGIR